MTGQPEEARRTQQVAQTPEQQAAKQGAEQQRDAEVARLQEEAAEELARLQQGEPAKRPPW